MKKVTQKLGAIIREGDRKSWDPRAPMIWDKTSYIRANPRTCRELSRGCCYVAWSNIESCEILLPIFHSDSREWGKELEPGLRHVLLRSEFMEKVCFYGSRISLISRCEWIRLISARTSCARKRLCLFCRELLCMKTLYSGIGLICEFPKQCLIITKTCFW